MPWKPATHVERPGPGIPARWAPGTARCRWGSGPATAPNAPSLLWLPCQSFLGCGDPQHGLMVCTSLMKTETGTSPHVTSSLGAACTDSPHTSSFIAASAPCSSYRLPGSPVSYRLLARQRDPALCRDFQPLSSRQKSFLFTTPHLSGLGGNVPSLQASLPSPSAILTAMSLTACVTLALHCRPFPSLDYTRREDKHSHHRQAGSQRLKEGITEPQPKGIRRRRQKPDFSSIPHEAQHRASSNMQPRKHATLTMGPTPASTGWGRAAMPYLPPKWKACPTEDHTEPTFTYTTSVTVYRSHQTKSNVLI